MKSIMQTDDRCYLCRMAVGTETHHVFPGNPNRKRSDQDGLTVRLCHPCHWKVHCDSQDDGRSMLFLKKKGQEAYELTHTREDFMKRYGRSWL